MDEDKVLMLAEVRANLTNEGVPTEEQYQVAETEVRAMLDEGWTYDDENGWQQPEGKN